jgi:transporter family-2 protein
VRSGVIDRGSALAIVEACAMPPRRRATMTGHSNLNQGKTMNVMYLLMALAGGAGLSIQAAINSRLSTGVGGQPLIAALISFAVGVLCLAVLAAVQADWQSATANLGEQPWWRWLGGMIGAAFVFTSVLLAPKLGVANTMFLFIIGQLAAGMAVDHWGLIQMPVRPVYWWKFAGMGVMLIGLVFFVFGDRLFQAD